MKALACFLLFSMVGAIAEMLFSAVTTFVKGRSARAVRRGPRESAVMPARTSCGGVVTAASVSPGLESKQT